MLRGRATTRSSPIRLPRDGSCPPVPRSPRSLFPGVFVLTAASLAAQNYTTEDPFVTVTNFAYASPTEVTFTVTVSSAAPTELDGFSLACWGNLLYGDPGFVNITPCAIPVTPAITSIQPDTWIAGHSTNITITGTGFIPTSNPSSCIPSGLAVSAGSENVVLSNVVVVSATQITATVTPAAGNNVVTATVTVSNTVYNPPPDYLTATATATIRPQPPVISSIQVNGAATNTIVAGTAGYLLINGQYLSGTTSVNAPPGVTISSFQVNSSQQISASFQASPSAATGQYSVTVTNPRGTSNGSPTVTVAITVTQFEFTTSYAYYRDCAGGNVKITLPTWPSPATSSCPIEPSTNGDAAVFEQGQTASGLVTFAVSPAPAQEVPGVTIQGAVSGLGNLVATAYTIPAAATFSATVHADTAFPSQTSLYNPMSPGLVCFAERERLPRFRLRQYRHVNESRVCHSCEADRLVRGSGIKLHRARCGRRGCQYPPRQHSRTHGTFSPIKTSRRGTAARCSTTLPAFRSAGARRLRSSLSRAAAAVNAARFSF